jgi:hypothetical protein
LEDVFNVVGLSPQGNIVVRKKFSRFAGDPPATAQAAGM